MKGFLVFQHTVISLDCIAYIRVQDDREDKSYQIIFGMKNNHGFTFSYDEEDELIKKMDYLEAFFKMR